MATLLLADDDAIVRYALALLLRSNGYHVLEAPSNVSSSLVITICASLPDAIATVPTR